MGTRTRTLAAESFGTFALVFAGTGAIVINDTSGGVVSHVGVALTFGLIVLAMIYALGDVSGCHLNPAVTIGFFVTEFDMAVTMGCGDECPFITARRRLDWQIPDPKEMPPEQFRAVRALIESKVKELLETL